MADIIEIEVINPEPQVIEVYVDMNSAQQAIDAAAEAESILEEIQNFNQTSQNNFVRKKIIYTSSLSGTGTIEDQVCEYLLSLPESERTILETDSAWILEIVEGSIPTGRKHNSKFNPKFN